MDANFLAAVRFDLMLPDRQGNVLIHSATPAGFTKTTFNRLGVVLCLSWERLRNLENNRISCNVGKEI